MANTANKPQNRAERLHGAGDGGHGAGWYLEIDGNVVGELSKPIWDQQAQFWHRYQIEATGDSEVTSEEFWQQKGHRLVFRNRYTDERVDDAIPGKFSRDPTGQAWIAMRGLYVEVDKGKWRQYLTSLTQYLFGNRNKKN